jgi:hypothetical protein
MLAQASIHDFVKAHAAWNNANARIIVKPEQRFIFVKKPHPPTHPPRIRY